MSASCSGFGQNRGKLCGPTNLRVKRDDIIGVKVSLTRETGHRGLVCVLGRQQGWGSDHGLTRVGGGGFEGHQGWGEVENVNKLSTRMFFELYMACGEDTSTFPERSQHVTSMAKITGHQPVKPCWPILRNLLVIAWRKLERGSIKCSPPQKT